MCETTPRRARTAAACLGRLYPAMSTLPIEGRESEARMRRKVVLPAPLGPSSATNSPGWTSKSSPRSTVFRPKRLTSFLTWIMRLGESLQQFFQFSPAFLIGFVGNLLRAMQIVESNDSVHHFFGCLELILIVFVILVLIFVVQLVSVT